MRNTQHEVKKYREKYVVTETYVDGELFKIKEEYYGDNKEIVYVYEYFPRTDQMLNAYNENENKKKEHDKKNNNKKNKNNKKKKNKNKKNKKKGRK